MSNFGMNPTVKITYGTALLLSVLFLAVTLINRWTDQLINTIELVSRSSQLAQVIGVGSTWYVSPTGTSSGDGSILNPWDLQTALNQPNSVKAGDTVWLRGGTYKGWFISKLVGTTAKPIIVRSYPGEWAVLDWNYDVKLVNAISASDTTVVITDDSFLNNSSIIVGELEMEPEILYVRLINSKNTLGVIRGWGGTTPKSFPAGARVYTPQSNLKVEGENTWFWDFEVTNSYDKGRILTTPGLNGDQSNRPDRRYGGISPGPTAKDIKFINIVIHDVGDGSGTNDQGTGNTEFSGVIVYSNGWTAPDRGHGHGFYIQNNIGSVNLNDVISFNNHATGQKVFGYAGHGNNIFFDGFVAFGNKEDNFFLGTGSNPMNNIHVKNSYIYSPPVSWGGGGMFLGWADTKNNDIEIKDNYIAGRKNGLAVNRWNSVVATGNTIWVIDNPVSGSSMVSLRPNPGILAPALTWDNNIYYDNVTPWSGNGKTYIFAYSGSDGGPNTLGGGNHNYTLDWLRLTPFDRNSTYISGTPGGVPPENKVFVRPNKYEAGRANIIIYNWLKQSSVSVDISGVGLNTGDKFEVRDVQNYFGTPVLTGTYSGQTISIPMTGLTVSSPVGTLANMPVHTAPEFGVFIVKRTSFASGGTTPPPPATPPPTPPPATTPASSPGSTPSTQSTSVYPSSPTPSAPSTSYTQPPIPSGPLTLTLTGNNPAHIDKGSRFLDPGLNVKGSRDYFFKITASVDGKNVGDVNNFVLDTTIPATHNITYTVTDSDGKSATITRTVVVGTSGYTTTTQTGSSSTSGGSTVTNSTTTQATSSIKPANKTLLPPFTKTLKRRSNSLDVKRLQVFLNTHGFKIASTGPGSRFNETTYYGPATARALSNFQLAHLSEILLSERVGGGNFFGLSTMKAVNKLNW